MSAEPQPKLGWPGRALVAALLATACLGGATGSAAAVEAAPTPARAVQAENGAEPASADPDNSGPAARLVVAPASPVFTGDEEQFVFEVLLENTGDQQLGAGTVSLRLDGLPAQSFDDLSVAQQDRESALLARFDADRTEPGEQQLFELTVDRLAMPRLFTREPGVYVLRAGYLPYASGDEDTSPLATDSVTPLVWKGAGAPLQGPDEPGEAGEEVEPNEEGEPAPLPLTLVVPLLLPTTVLTLPSAEELASAAPALIDLLDAAESGRATLAIDPRIVAGIRSLGTLAPGIAQELLERLEATPLPHFMLQFADADPAVQAAMGFEQLLQPVGFTYLTDHGIFEPDQPPEVSDIPEVEVAGYHVTALSDGVPTLDTLLTLTEARPGAWPAAGEVSTDTLSLLETAGVRSLVLETNNTSAATGTRGSIGGFDVLLADSALASAARQSFLGPSRTDQWAGSAELTARLALGAQVDTGGAILALDRELATDPAAAVGLMSELDALDWVSFVSEQQQPTGSITFRDGTVSESRAEMLERAMTRSAKIDEQSALLATPEYLIEFQRARLLELFATRYAQAGADLGLVESLVEQRDTELMGGVQPVTTESTQLVGSSSRLPVTLRNALPFEAVVQLRATPLSAAITLPERTFEVRVPGEGRENVLVPVQSRVSSGESGLALEVRDAQGERAFHTHVLRLTLRTTVETILLVSLAGGAALLFGFGIWRSVKRRRVVAQSVRVAE